jgi:hypothetical protein
VLESTTVVTVAAASVNVFVRSEEPVVVTLSDSPEPSGADKVAFIIAPGIAPAASAAGLPEIFVNVTDVGEVVVATANAVERSAVFAE